MDAYSLIGATSTIGSEEEFEEHLSALKVPTAIRNILKTLIESMNDEIDISLVHPNVGAQTRITGEGLNYALKNYIKFVPRKD
jgi:hypothetical protein